MAVMAPMAANMGALAESFGLRQGLRYRVLEQASAAKVAVANPKALTSR